MSDKERDVTGAPMSEPASTCRICDRPDPGNEGDPCRQCEDEFWSDPPLIVLDDPKDIER